MMDVFPGINYAHAEMDALKKIVADVCREKHLVCGMEEEDCGHSWTEKVRQQCDLIRRLLHDIGSQQEPQIGSQQDPQIGSH